MLHSFKFSELYTKLLKGHLVFRKTPAKTNWLGINVNCQQAQTRKNQLVKVNTFDTVLPDLNFFFRPHWQVANSYQLSFLPEVEQFTQKPRQQSLKSSNGVPAIKYWASFFSAGIKSESLFLGELPDKVPEAQPPPVSEGQSPGEGWLYGELQQPLRHGRNLDEIQYGPEGVGGFGLHKGGLALHLTGGSPRTVLSFGKVLSMDLLPKEVHVSCQDLQKDIKYVHA